MKLSKTAGTLLSGIAAGAVNGLFGTGGGMVLIPLLSSLAGFDEEQIFPSSVAIILPLCLVSIAVTAVHTPLPWLQALPYLLGSAAGGLLAGCLGKRIPIQWLHRIFGGLILMGGLRYLW